MNHTENYTAAHMYSTGNTQKEKYTAVHMYATLTSEIQKYPAELMYSRNYTGKEQQYTCTV